MVSPPQHFKMLYLIYAWFKVCMCKSTNCICFVALNKLPRHKFAWFCLIEKHAQNQNSKRTKWKVKNWNKKGKEKKTARTHTQTAKQSLACNCYLNCISYVIWWWLIWFRLPCQLGILCISLYFFSFIL